MPGTVLMEVAVEDFPPLTVKMVLIQMEEKGRVLLSSYRLDYERIKVLGSSRRLIFWLEGVPPQQRDRVEKEIGPPYRMVFDEKGNLTSSGEKYLRARRVNRSELGIEKLQKGKYVYIRRVTVGKKTIDVLPLLFRELIKSLRFTKSMKWGSYNFSFGRPIRSILALYDSQIVEFQIAGVSAGRKTRGHRYLSPSPREITAPEEYVSHLRERSVIVDPEERRKSILRQMEKILSFLSEKEEKVTILEDSQLLEEMVYLVEHPTIFWGKFDSRFLSLPFPILQACLRDYQKHFCVIGSHGPLPYFVGVREGDENYLGEVVSGNSRVIDARLTDAKFFFEEDKKVSLAQRVPSLKTVIVQDKLGSYYDKVQRLMGLSAQVSEHLSLLECQKIRLTRAAFLCKADLLTNVVKEFPRLQGIMGRVYALQGKEDPTVAQAIAEHRMPRFNGDECPSTVEGAALAIVDKLDTLVGSFWAGFIPSTSEDPWGLRREAQAIFEIVEKRKWPFSLNYLMGKNMELYGQSVEAEARLREFFRSRLINYLRGKELPVDLIRAVIKGFFEDLGGVFQKALVLKQISLRRNFKEEVIAIMRLLNILRQASGRRIVIPPKIRKELLEIQEEKVLYEKWGKMKTPVENLVSEGHYWEGYQNLIQLKEHIHNFFEKVMVMCEDENLRDNRLALLREIGGVFNRIADFTKIQVN